MVVAPVDMEAARRCAREAALRFIERKPVIRGPAGGNLSNFSASNFSGWLDRLDPGAHEDVQEIYDTNGRLLFRDFVTLNGALETRVRTAADEVLGAPVFSIGVHEPLPIRQWLTDAEVLAVKLGYEPERSVQGLVCYCYPKLGLLCRGKGSERLVIDLSDHSIYPISVAPHGPGTAELKLAWSPFDAVHPAIAGANRQRYKDISLHFAIRAEHIVADLNARAGLAQSRSRQRVLTGLTLVAQQTPVYCAVACGKMLLDFVGLTKTQEEIAAAMHTDASGTTASDQLAGFASLLGDAWSPALDQTPTLSELQDEIEAGRPVKMGIPGHARVVGGWKSQSLDRVEEKITTAIQVYDPWPVNEGRIYWEFWGAVGALNTLTLERRLLS